MAGAAEVRPTKEEATVARSSTDPNIFMVAVYSYYLVLLQRWVVRAWLDDDDDDLLSLLLL